MDATSQREELRPRIPMRFPPASAESKSKDPPRMSLPIYSTLDFEAAARHSEVKAVHLHG